MKLRNNITKTEGIVEPSGTFNFSWYYFYAGQ